MKYLKKMKNEGGFSLVELMVSVGIIGAMSSIAVPRYQKFTANAAQAEAHTSLSSMYTLQQLYFTENDEYATDLKPSGQLDFPVSSNARYDYDTEASAPSGPITTKILFKATAVSKEVLASCATTKDKWCVNQNKEMTNGSPAPTAPCAAGDVADGGCS